MVRTTVLALVLAGLVGCRGSPAEPPCSAVAARFLDLARSELANAKVSDTVAHAVGDQLPAMRDALVQACTEGGWSAATRKCLIQAGDHTGFEACEQQLTDEQRRDLDRATRGTTGSP